MFGHEHDQTGVLIDTADEYSIDATDTERLATLRNKLWCVLSTVSQDEDDLKASLPRPIVEEANKDAAAFSRIYKEMIIFTSPSKPFPRSAKGTVMRKAALALYDEEIEAL
jgi:hypothetical protein